MEIEIGDVIGFRDDHWQIRDYDGLILRIMCLSTGIEMLLPTGKVLADSTFRPPGESGRSVADQRLLDLLSESRRAEAEFWEMHMREVHTGNNSGKDGAGSQTVEQRLSAKRDELAALGTRVSMSTMWRKYGGFVRAGAVGCADLRGMPGHVRTAQLDERVVGIFNDVRTGFTYRSTPSRKQVIEMAKHRLTEDGLRVPCRTSSYELLRSLDRGEQTHGEARARRSYVTSPERAFGKVYALFPGEEVQLDTTPLDAMVLMADGQICRVDLAIAIDVATRSILAAILRPNACKSVDAIELVSRAMLPLELLPGWTEQMAIARSYLGETFSVEAEISECLAARPLIDVRGVVSDLGSIFISAAFLNAMEARGIEVRMAPPGTPTAKPIVERVFKTIADDFVRYIPGYKGRAVAHRGKHPETEAVWPLNVVQSLMDEWIVTVYQKKPHDGLRLPGAPRIQHSPNEIYRALSEVAPGNIRALTVEEWIALLPCAWRRINRYGLNFNRLLYDNRSERFQTLRRGKSANRAQNGKWEVRYDPANLLQIWVRDLTYGEDVDGKAKLMDRGWIECRWVLADYTSIPFGIDVLQAVIAGLGKRNVTDQEVLARSEEIHRRLIAGPSSGGDQSDATKREQKAARSNLTRQNQRPEPRDVDGSEPSDEPVTTKHSIEKPEGRLEPMRPLRLSDGW